MAGTCFVGVRCLGLWKLEEELHKLNNKEWVVKLQADGMGWGGVMRVEEIRDGLGL